MGFLFWSEHQQSRVLCLRVELSSFTLRKTILIIFFNSLLSLSVSLPESGRYALCSSSSCLRHRQIARQTFSRQQSVSPFLLHNPFLLQVTNKSYFLYLLLDSDLLFVLYVICRSSKLMTWL